MTASSHHSRVARGGPLTILTNGRRLLRVVSREKPPAQLLNLRKDGVLIPDDVPDNGLKLFNSGALLCDLLLMELQLLLDASVQLRE